MKKVALSLVLVLICGSVFAGGLNASFIGSRFDCPFVIDFANLSRMDMWIAQPPEGTESNTGMTYSANTGTATFDTGDTEIRVGQQYNDLVECYCHNRALNIEPVEVRP